jgi:hypothetical protein
MYYIIIYNTININYFSFYLKKGLQIYFHKYLSLNKEI